MNVEDQSSHHHHHEISEALSECIAKKKLLSDEICELVRKIEEKEKRQQLDVVQKKKEIECIKKENFRLQFACYEMQQLLLERSRSNETTSLSDRAKLNFPSDSCVQHVNILSGGENCDVKPCGNDQRNPVLPSSSSLAIEPSVTSRSQSRLTFPARDPSLEEEQSWPCSRCTFSNSGFLNECEICGSQRFACGDSNIPEASSSISYAGEPEKPCYCHGTYVQKP